MYSMYYVVVCQKMDLRSIYISNGIGVVLLAMLLYTSRVRIVRRRTEDRIYAFLVFGVMIACFMEALSYTIDGKMFPCARLLNYIANVYLYSVNLLLPFCVLVYVDLGLYGDMSRIWEKYKPQIIIGIIMFSLTILNFFVPISYVITDKNVYERRPFSYVYYFVILYYMISSIFLTKRYEKENGAKTFFNIHMFLMPILIGAGLQFMFYGLSLAWLSAAVGLVGLYMMQQNEMSYIDALTDTYNRQYLNLILMSWIRRGRNFSGAMLDLDDFKSINDRFGHTEGDKALKTVADMLKDSRKNNELIFRFAGDEFIILKMATSPPHDDLSSFFKELNNSLELYNDSGHQYRIALSYGTSTFGHDDIDSFMRELDTRMYEMKALHHGKREKEKR